MYGVYNVVNEICALLWWNIDVGMREQWRVLVFSPKRVCLA